MAPALWGLFRLFHTAPMAEKQPRFLQPCKHPSWRALKEQGKEENCLGLWKNGGGDKGKGAKMCLVISCVRPMLLQRCGKHREDALVVLVPQISGLCHRSLGCVSL